MTNSTLTGSIKFFNTDKNFGFVTVEGVDHHFKLATLKAAGFQATDAIVGATVEFNPETTAGRPRVGSVKRIGMQLANPPKQAKTTSPEPQMIEIGKRYIGEVINYHDDRGFGFMKVLGGKFRNVYFHVSNMLVDDLPIEGERYHFTAVEGRTSVAAGMLFIAIADVTPDDYEKLVKNFGQKDEAPAPANQLVRKQVDKNDAGDKLIKVSRFGRLVHYEVERANDMGTYILEGVRTLVEARDEIGKVLPEIRTESKPTNDPALSQSMKGSHNGGEKKKAA
jgi:cold shock CspA family protein